MKPSNFVLLMLLAVGGCNGCPSTSITNNASSGPEDGSKGTGRRPGEDQAELSVKVEPRKTTVNGQPTHLSQEESNSLRQALAGKPAGRIQLYAEVAKGQLVFRSDADVSHTGNSNLSMVVDAEDGGDSLTPIKLVATPEAARILLNQSAR